MSNEAVIVKMINGDLFMALHVQDTTHHSIFENPVTIKVISVPGMGGVVEKTITAPFCSLTEDSEFRIRQDQIIYIKPLHSNIKAYYYKLIEAFKSEESLNEFTADFSEESSDSEDLKENEDSLPQEHNEDSFIIIPDTKTIH